MDYSSFLTNLRRNELKSAYLFIGKEDYLAESGVQELVSRLLTPEERDLNLTVLTPRDGEDLARSLTTPPMFAKRRVIVVKQAGDLADQALETVAYFLKKPPDDACLVLVAGDADKRKSFFKTVVPLIDPVLCNKLKTNELQQWIGAYIGRYDKQIDSESVARLSSLSWPSLRELAGELERLTLMIGSKNRIDISDVQSMGGASFALERWRLGEAVGMANLPGALEVMVNLQNWGLRSNQIIGDIYRTLRQLWIIRWHIDQKKPAEAKRFFDIADFIFNKLQKQAGALPLVNIEEALLRILEAELNIKTGLRDDELEANLAVTEAILALKSGKSLRGAA